MNIISTSQVTQTFTLPSGKVLKGVSILGAGGACGIATFSSSGNTTQTYTVPTSWTAYTTGWTTASATVTVAVTCSAEAYGVYFTNLIYGSP